MTQVSNDYLHKRCKLKVYLEDVISTIMPKEPPVTKSQVQKKLEIMNRKYLLLCI